MRVQAPECSAAYGRMRTTHCSRVVQEVCTLLRMITDEIVA